MKVNTPRTAAAAPADLLEQRVIAILAALGPSALSADPGLRGRVRAFIECNGYEGVHRAARITARKARREAVSDPWAYTVQVFNGTLARLSYIYGLVHLVENALRSQVDLAYTRAWGPNWYLIPSRYVPPGRENEFVGGIVHTRLRWDPRADPRRPKQILPLESSAAFLDGISMGWLVQLVLHGHAGHLHGVLVSLDGTVVRRSQAKKLLDIARRARNAVAHNRPVTNEEFREASAALVRLLEALRFDVPKALHRTERTRLSLVGALLRDMGVPLTRPNGR
ncbi:MAG: hypothetical protein ACRDJN_28775 [Chloroflexota bacterium]